MSDVLNYCQRLGAEVVDADNYRISFPIGDAKAIVPKINELGLRCTEVAQRQEMRSGGMCSITVVELSRNAPACSEHDEFNSLMNACIK
jgi:hypothetical protein